MATSFGGAVKLTGESEYRKALQNITQNLKEVTSEMKLVTAQYGKNDTSIEALSAKSDVLNKKLEVQKERVATLKKQYEAMATQYEKNATKHDNLAKRYEDEKSKLSTLEKTLGTTSQEYKEQADKVADLSEQLKKSEANQEANTKTLSNMRIQLNNAEGDIAKTSREIKDLANQMENGADSAEDLGDAVEDAGESADSATGGFTVFKGALADIVANVITSAISKMKELVSNTIEVGQNFQSSMAKVQAISGATDEDLQLLTDTAKKFGSTTKYSASESADALGYMALAGWDAKTSASALGGVLNLASASGMDLARASDMVTDYLSAFGMQADQSAYFADLLAYAQGNANTSAEQLGEAYKNCSANLASAGQDIETTTALLSMLANQGLKGSEAGTALNAIVRDMTSKMKDGAIQIGETTIEVQDAEGNFRDLTEILKEVESATDGMGTAQKASALQSTFTADSIKGLNLILNAGVTSAEDFEKALRNSTGTAETMAGVMNNTLAGDMTALNSQIEGVQISLYEKFEPALRAGVEALSKLVDVVSWLIDNSDGVVTAITAMATAVGTYVAYTTALKVMKEGWTALTLVTKAQTIAQTALNAVMSANPIGLVIALVAGLVAGFVVLWNKSEAFRNFFINMWDGIKKTVSKTVDTIKAVFNTVVNFFKDNWQTIALFLINPFAGLFKFAYEHFEGFRNFIDGIIEKVKNIFSSAVETIKGVFENVVNFFKENWQTILTFLINPFAGLFKYAYEHFEGFRNFVDGVVEKIKTAFAPLVNFFKTAFEIIGQLAQGCLELIKLAWGTVSTWFNSNVVAPIIKFFNNLWDGIVTGASNAWELVKTAWAFVTSWFDTNIIQPVGNFFTGLWENITTGASKAWELVKTAWSTVTTWFNSTIVTPVTNYFKTMWDNLKTGASNAWNGIKAVFSVVSDWFKDVFTKAWTNVKNVFSTGGKIFTGIKEGIESAFKTVVNAIIRGVNKVVALPFNAINNMLDKIRNVTIAGVAPFKGLISRFSVPQIPLLAKGGIVDGATFVAGEDGKEAIIPLERNTGWISKVAQEIAQILETPLIGLADSIKGMQIPQTQNDYSYNDIVNAFKDALGQMKVVLDDEEMGHFVEKTVADAIYT